ncbi:MAG: hypothetical protein ACI8X5_000893 [Planctomycetota bacterium]|jgi:hypothetical protein
MFVLDPNPRLTDENWQSGPLQGPPQSRTSLPGHGPSTGQIEPNWIAGARTAPKPELVIVLDSMDGEAAKVATAQIAASVCQSDRTHRTLDKATPCLQG